MSEYEEAVNLANIVLDNPCIDPDGDTAMLARQFLRVAELNKKLDQLLSLCRKAEQANGHSAPTL